METETKKVCEVCEDEIPSDFVNLLCTKCYAAQVRETAQRVQDGKDEQAERMKVIAKPEEIKEVARLFRWYGFPGVNYWVAGKRGHDPQIPKRRTEVEYVRSQEKPKHKEQKETIGFFRRLYNKLFGTK